MLQAIIGWLTSLPPWALYLALALFAALENVFPPVPADTIVALGAVLAARGQANIFVAFATTLVGNVSGAALMYTLGRRHGAEHLEKRLGATETSREKLESYYGRHGLGALFVSRFVPGVRALVPPFAGAARVPAGRAIGVMAVASAIWYGAISWVGFRIGSDFPRLMRIIQRSERWIGAVAALLLLGFGIAWWRRRRHHASRAS
ncbi:MAG: associated protein [Gemmatimonadetes bacterium]|nr:associated protein [Gemmatimonadota bacterium]